MSGTFLPKRCKELGQRDFKRERQASNCGDADVTLPSFDATNVIPMQRGARGELLLRHAQLLTELPHSFAHRNPQIMRHRENGGGLNTIGLHTIVFIS